MTPADAHTAGSVRAALPGVRGGGRQRVCGTDTPSPRCCRALHTHTYTSRRTHTQALAQRGRTPRSLSLKANRAIRPATRSRVPRPPTPPVRRGGCGRQPAPAAAASKGRCALCRRSLAYARGGGRRHRQDATRPAAHTLALLRHGGRARPQPVRVVRLVGRWGGRRARARSRRPPLPLPRPPPARCRCLRHAGKVMVLLVLALAGAIYYSGAGGASGHARARSPPRRPSS